MADEMTPQQYNQRVGNAINHLKATLPTFAVVEKLSAPQNQNSHGIILMEKGCFYGMGYSSANVSSPGIDIENIKEQVTRYPESDYIRGLIYQHVAKYPARKVEFL